MGLNSFASSIRSAGADRNNIKIAAAFAGGLAVAVIAISLNSESNPNVQADASSDCAGQTWPYVDQKCADEMKRTAEKSEKPRLREVRVISTDQTAPAKVVMMPAAEPEKAPVAEATADKPLPPSQGVAATTGIGSAQDAFATTSALPAPSNFEQTAAVETVSPATPSDAAASNDEKTATVKPVTAKSKFKPSLVTPAVAATAVTPKVNQKTASKTKAARPTEREISSNYVPGPNEVVQERVTTLADGRTVTMRRIYRNVRPDAAYEMARQRRSAYAEDF